MRLAVNPSTLTVLACVSLGCAYYNGLYNANRLANEAGKAEREGRRGEAQSLWTRAAVKAESVTTRYPDSKYYDDALLLQGRALSRIGECRDAVRPLHAAVTESVDGELRVEAALLLGRCQLEVGETDTAWATLSALVDHDDPSVTSRALYWRGRAALAAGRPAAALDDLKRTAEPTALFDRALAMTELGFTREAASTLDTASALTFAEDRWAQVLARLGAVDLQSASALVERLLARNDLTSGERARLLMADGVRWTPADPAYAADRFTAAVTAAGDSLEGRVARAHLAIAQIRRTTDLEQVVELTDEFGSLMLEGGEVVTVAGGFADLLDGIVLAIETPAPRHADLRIFRGAETARDSLAALPLAARLFLLVRERYPESVIAPKALLAAAALRLDTADSLRAIVRNEYPTSPYTLAASGEFSAAYTAVEDSLRTLLVREIIRPR